MTADRSVSCSGEDLSSWGTAAAPGASVTIAGITTATGVAVGGGAGSEPHACAVLTDGTIRCWGGGFNGELGDGTTDDSPTPVQVVGITTATAVAAGEGTSCALLANHEVRCWGSGYHGALGNGEDVYDSKDSAVPVAVSGVTTATAIATGNLTGCALLDDGSVRCWGMGMEDRSTPVTVLGITTAVAISVSDQDTPCAVLKDHTLWCWGTRGDQAPVRIPAFGEVARYSSGSTMDCVLRNDGSVACMGQLPDGKEANASPAPAPGISNASEIAVGGSFVCAQPSDRRSTICWGLDASGH